MSVQRRDTTADRQPGATRRTQQRLRRFVFTLNNWTDEEYEQIKTQCAPVYFKWMVMGREKGDAGTPHLQGAAILLKQTAFTSVKNLPGLKRAHIAEMKGTPEQSLAYCTKEDTNAFQFGALPQPGKRNDVHNAAERIIGGESLRSLAKDTEGAVAVVKFFKGLTVLRSLTRPERTAPPQVFWIYGQTGTGKTRCAFESARDLSESESDIWISSGGLKWFDGYDGQSVAIFDDFRAKHVPNFPFLLRLLDRYPMSVEIKGASVQWLPKYIFITCPYEPDVCFSKRKEHVPEDIAQLHRRLTKVYHFANKLKKDARRKFVESVRSFVPRGDGTVDIGGTRIDGVLPGNGEMVNDDEPSTTPTQVINLDLSRLVNSPNETKEKLVVDLTLDEDSDLELLGSLEDEI
ncbi:MAG: helicase [Cressdnaviricota sp.]|nr:MAG: helicase [Cressdnaviricota sp.]